MATTFRAIINTQVGQDRSLDGMTFASTTPGKGGLGDIWFSTITASMYSSGTRSGDNASVIYTSTDYGDNWILTGTAPEVAANNGAFIQIPSTGTWIMTSTQSGKVWRSTNRGASWTAITVHVNTFGGIIRGFAQKSSTILCISDDQISGNIFRSTDDGQTWTSTFNNPPSDTQAGLNIDADPAGNFFWASWTSGATGSQQAQLFRSGDGITWTLVFGPTTPGTTTFASYTFAHQIGQRADGRYVFYDTGAREYLSADSGGGGWTLNRNFDTGGPGAGFWGTQAVSGFLFGLRSSNSVFSTNSGSTWSAAGSNLASNSKKGMTGMPGGTIVAATVPEFPHFPDRGLPIEIAGPRNDQTRKAYLPTVRIFTS
jgi:hypothetical protein